MTHDLYLPKAGNKKIPPPRKLRFHGRMIVPVCVQVTGNQIKIRMDLHKRSIHRKSWDR